MRSFSTYPSQRWSYIFCAEVKEWLGSIRQEAEILKKRQEKRLQSFSLYPGIEHYAWTTVVEKHRGFHQYAFDAWNIFPTPLNNANHWYDLWRVLSKGYKLNSFRKFNSRTLKDIHSFIQQKIRHSCRGCVHIFVFWSNE